MRLFLLALLFGALLALAFPALAQEPPPIKMQEVEIQCRGGVCILPEALMDAIVANNNKLADEVLKLRERVKEPVTCAKTEVTEPSKKHPMTPAPKPAVPFKLEQNT